jgi:hypothetical protein
MQIQQKINLSIYYYLKGLLPPVVNLTDNYPVGYDGTPRGDLVLPTVAVVRQPITVLPFELGGKGLDHYLFVADIYAKTKAQRDDLAYLIQNDMNSNDILVYDYDLGFPPTVVPQLGVFAIEGNIDNRVVYVFPELVEILYWRAVVSFGGYFSH